MQQAEKSIKEGSLSLIKTINSFKKAIAYYQRGESNGKCDGINIQNTNIALYKLLEASELISGIVENDLDE